MHLSAFVNILENSRNFLRVNIRVLVPGVGLGRLAFDVANLG